MIRSKKLIILLLFFILFSTYSPNYKSNNKSIIFGLETIKLEGLRILNKKDLEIKLGPLKGRSLFRIDQKMIQSKLEETKKTSINWRHPTPPKSRRVHIAQHIEKGLAKSMDCQQSTAINNQRLHIHSQRVLKRDRKGPTTLQ